MSVELDGQRWVPVPGGTATAEQFVAARSLLAEVHRLMRWSPWVLQDRAAEYEAAWQTCAQWTIGGPRPPTETAQEYEAEVDQRLADVEAQFEARRRQAEIDRAARASRYDDTRARARLALLEQQAMLAAKIRERDEIRSGEKLSWATDEARRQALASRDRDIAAQAKQAEELAAVDPESVADSRGWLPAERRELALTLFKTDRIAEVRVLRGQIASGQAALTTLTGRAEKAQARKNLRRAQARLASLEEMPPLQAEDMCSECVSPASHTPETIISLDSGMMTGGPCPAWPQWADSVDRTRQALHAPAQPPPARPAPPARPQPIAVLAPGKPIEDVIAQLTIIQASHPGAQIRQAKGHRWEIWPPPTPQQPLDH